MPRHHIVTAAIALTALAAPVTLGAQRTRTQPKPAKVQHKAAPAVPQLNHGFAPDRLARIDAYLQQYVDSNRVAGAVVLVMRDGDVVYEKAVGWADAEAKKRMQPDAMFRIASQTKALTTVAALMLMEEGKLALNNPVSRFIPQYALTTVATRGENGVRLISPANRPITIKDLMTHTAGISYGTDSLVASLYADNGLGPAAGWGWYTADKDEPICHTMERLATLPFVRQPGEAFVYGYNTDILGCVVERASGVPLDEFIRTRITAPLGMNDTYFFPPASKRDRVVAVYASDSTNHAYRAPDNARGQGAYLDGPKKSFAGGAGLVSTTRDYARLLQMLLNGGELNGARILSPATVDLMTANQTGTLYTQPGGGQGFGLGFSIVERAGADNTLLPAGTWGWGSAYGGQYRVDPKHNVILIFEMNQLPNRTDLWAKLPNVVYSALVK